MSNTGRLTYEEDYQPTSEYGQYKFRLYFLVLYQRISIIILSFTLLCHKKNLQPLIM